MTCTTTKASTISSVIVQSTKLERWLLKLPNLVPYHRVQYIGVLPGCTINSIPRSLGNDHQNHLSHHPEIRKNKCNNRWWSPTGATWDHMDQASAPFETRLPLCGWFSLGFRRGCNPLVLMCSQVAPAGLPPPHDW